MLVPEAYSITCHSACGREVELRRNARHDVGVLGRDRNIRRLKRCGDLLGPLFSDALSRLHAATGFVAPLVTHEASRLVRTASQVHICRCGARPRCRRHPGPVSSMTAASAFSCRIVGSSAAGTSVFGPDPSYKRSSPMLVAKSRFYADGARQSCLQDIGELALERIVDIGSVHTGPTGEECITVADIATCACNGVVGHGLPEHWRIAERTPARESRSRAGPSGSIRQVPNRVPGRR